MTPEQSEAYANYSFKVAWVLFFFVIVGVIYIIFFAKDNVCIQMTNTSDIYIEPQDLEKFCFRTLGEANQKKAELDSKYSIYPDAGLNLSVLNFSLD